MYRKIVLSAGIAALAAVALFVYSNAEHVSLANSTSVDEFTQFMIETGQFGPPPTDLENWDTSLSYSYSKGPEEIYPGVYQTTLYATAPENDPPGYVFRYEADTLEGFRWLVANRYKPLIERAQTLYLSDPEDDNTVLAYRDAISSFAGSAIRHEVKFAVSLEEDFAYIEQMEALLEPGESSRWVEIHSNVWERVLSGDKIGINSVSYRTDGSLEADSWLLGKFKEDAEAAKRELAALGAESATEQGELTRLEVMVERYQLQLAAHMDAYGELPEFAKADYSPNE